MCLPNVTFPLLGSKLLQGSSALFGGPTLTHTHSHPHLHQDEAVPPPWDTTSGLTVRGTARGDLHCGQGYVTLRGPSSPWRGVDVVGGPGGKNFWDCLWKVFLEFASVCLHFISILYCGLSVVLLILTLDV